MKLTYTIGLASTVALFSLGAWLGCSSSSSGGNPAGNDAGMGNDTGGGMDSPSQMDVTPPPDSGGDGGTPAVSCMTYCMTVTTACTGNLAQYALTAPHTDPPFSALQQCLNMCAAMPVGTYGETANSVGCRQYHADNVAIRGEPASVHCPHAGPYGGDLCGDRCTDFCSLAVPLCSTANGNPQQWATVADCMSACTAYPYDPDAGQYDPNDLNHLNCFEYHLREAYTQPDAAEPDDSGDTVSQSHCGDLIIGDAAANPPGSCIQ